MIMGKVVGNVVSTQKDDQLNGFKLLVVRQVDLEMKPTKSYIIAVDAVEAGENEIVLVATGSSARMTRVTKEKPVDAVIMAIVDKFETEGKEIYNKTKEG